jgi:hypothetical protein
MRTGRSVANELREEPTGGGDVDRRAHAAPRGTVRLNRLSDLIGDQDKHT